MPKSKEIIIFQSISFEEKEKQFFNYDYRLYKQELTSEEKELVEKITESQSIPNSQTVGRLRIERDQQCAQVKFAKPRNLQKIINKLSFFHEPHYRNGFVKRRLGIWRMIKQCMYYIYKIAKFLLFAVVLLLFYLMLLLMNIKWPKFDKSESKSCGGDDGCCPCEEIQKKAEAREQRLGEAIKNWEDLEIKHSQGLMTGLLGLEAMMGLPWINEGKEKIDQERVTDIQEIEKKMETEMKESRYSGNMACECNEIRKAHGVFKEFILDEFRKYGLEIIQDETMLNRIRKIDQFLRKNNICDDDLTDNLMKFLKGTSEKIHIDPNEFNFLHRILI